MHEELDQLAARIDTLELKLALGKMEARDKLETLRGSLRQRIQPFRGRLDELARETGEAWGDLSSGFSAAWAETRQAVGEALDRYR